MIKKALVILLLTVSSGKGQELVQVKLKTGNTVSGDFIGTYMEHIHLLIDDNINYFKCDIIIVLVRSQYKQLPSFIVASGLKFNAFSSGHPSISSVIPATKDEILL